MVYPWNARQMPIVQETMTFDHVFSEESTTRDIFQLQILDKIKDALDGVNVTVLAYGQTSSGKTYTMQGSKQEPGIIGMVVIYLIYRPLCPCSVPTS